MLDEENTITTTHQGMGAGDKQEQNQIKAIRKCPACHCYTEGDIESEDGTPWITCEWCGEVMVAPIDTQGE